MHDSKKTKHTIMFSHLFGDLTGMGSHGCLMSLEMCSHISGGVNNGPVDEANSF